MLRRHACRGHGRTVCTHGVRRWADGCMAAAWKAYALVLAADVAVGQHECTTCCSARRSLLVAAGFLHGRGPSPCSNRVAGPRRGRTAACEVHSPAHSSLVPPTRLTHHTSHITHRRGAPGRRRPATTCMIVCVEGALFRSSIPRARAHATDARRLPTSLRKLLCMLGGAPM
eukprot:31915-Prymnesium_polylepis.1